MKAFIGVGTDKSGFAVFELAPALLLLAGVIALSYHILAFGMSVDRSVRLTCERLASLQAVEDAWRDSGSRVALAEREADGKWRGLGFSGESWLPMIGTGGGGFIWRRRLVGSGPSALWHVEQLHGNPGEWIWWTATTAKAASLPSIDD
ncbi:MAG: hypothetical protein AB3N33_08100 [Puniceicoccaceae bacterium]